MSRKCRSCGKDFETDIDELHCSFECAYNIHETLEIVGALDILDISSRF